MATPGQLVSEIARVLGLPENAVVTPWRVLREAGIVTKGARGRNAPHTTSIDAAHALIAVASELPLKKVIHSWRVYANLPARLWHGNGEPKLGATRPVKDSGRWELVGLPFPTVKALRANHTFAEALSAFIDDAAHNPVRELLKVNYRLTIRILGPYPHAYIALWSGDFQERLSYENRPKKFTEAAERKWAAAADRAFKGDLQQARSLSQQTILALGHFLSRSEEK